MFQKGTDGFRKGSVKLNQPSPGRFRIRSAIVLSFLWKRHQTCPPCSFFSQLNDISTEVNLPSRVQNDMAAPENASTARCGAAEAPTRTNPTLAQSWKGAATAICGRFPGDDRTEAWILVSQKSAVFTACGKATGGNDKLGGFFWSPVCCVRLFLSFSSVSSTQPSATGSPHVSRSCSRFLF